MAVLIKKCPSGHELTFDHFHSIVNAKEPDLMKAIIFTCDGGRRGHSFNLEKAAKAGMFTPEEVKKLKTQAIIHKIAWLNQTVARLKGSQPGEDNPLVSVVLHFKDGAVLRQAFKEPVPQGEAMKGIGRMVAEFGRPLDFDLPESASQ